MYLNKADAQKIMCDLKIQGEYFFKNTFTSLDLQFATEGSIDKTIEK
ncbi:MAG: hypothetical protein RR190_00685 [Bacteroidales bacterium]